MRCARGMCDVRDGYVRAIYVFVMRLFLVHIDRHNQLRRATPVKGSADIGTATSGLPTRLVPHRESLCHSHRPRLEQGPCADSSGFVPIAELNSDGAVPANSDQIARQGLCQWPSLKQWVGSTRDCLQTKKDPTCVESNDPVYF